MPKTATWFRIHSFAGVFGGLMLFVICWSGTFAVFSEELDWLVDPNRRVTPEEKMASWGAIEGAVEAAYPGASVTYMYAPIHRRAAAEVYAEAEDGSSSVFLVDPYTAEVTKRYGEGSYSGMNLQVFFRQFHYELFGLNGFGFYIVTLFAPVLLLLLLSALRFFKRWWRALFRWPRGEGRTWWSSLHTSLGVWSLWFLFLIGATGLWYLYEAAQHDLFDGPLNYVGNPPIGVVAVPEPETDPALPKLPLDQIIAKAKAVWPELEIGVVAYGWYSGGEETVYLQGRTGGLSLMRGRANQMHLDPRTGEILWQNSAVDLPPYWLLSNMADPLHFGNFAGLWSKAVWFVFGLALCGLILSGTWLYAHRSVRNFSGKARWTGVTASVVVTLLILGASVPAGFDNAREYYGPTVDGVEQLPTLAPGVKAVIVGWVALTVAIIAAWCALLLRPEWILQKNKNSS